MFFQQGSVPSTVINICMVYIQEHLGGDRLWNHDVKFMMGDIVITKTLSWTMARVPGHVGADFFPEHFFGLMRSLAGIGRRKTPKKILPAKKTQKMFGSSRSTYFAKKMQKRGRRKNTAASVSTDKFPQGLEQNNATSRVHGRGGEETSRQV